MVKAGERDNGYRGESKRLQSMDTAKQFGRTERGRERSGGLPINHGISRCSVACQQLIETVGFGLRQRGGEMLDKEGGLGILGSIVGIERSIREIDLGFRWPGGR